MFLKESPKQLILQSELNNLLIWPLERERDVPTTVALCVIAKVFKWKADTKAIYSESNDDIKTRNLKNQVKARVQDFNISLWIR